MTSITYTIDPESLVETSDTGWTGYDRDATLEQFETNLVARVTSAFPGTDVSVRWSPVLTTTVTSDGLDEVDDTDLAYYSELVWDAQDFWVAA
jgi:hypothetical protein